MFYGSYWLALKNILKMEVFINIRFDKLRSFTVARSNLSIFKVVNNKIHGQNYDRVLMIYANNNVINEFSQVLFFNDRVKSNYEVNGSQYWRQRGYITTSWFTVFKLKSQSPPISVPSDIIWIEKKSYLIKS